MTTPSMTDRLTTQRLRHYPDPLSAFEAEWQAGRSAGYPCELWSVGGGEDERRGFTVFWFPTARLAWVLSGFDDPMWYGNVEHPCDFETVYTASSRLQPLPSYVPLRAQCGGCRTRLTDAERARVQRLAEAHGGSPDHLCAICAELACYEEWPSWPDPAQVSEKLRTLQEECP